jgi:hypothetical protein
MLKKGSIKQADFHNFVHQLSLAPEDAVVLDNASIQSAEPMVPELIFHHVRGRHNRLWLRISWQLGPQKFMPMSFLLDTGAPQALLHV